MTITPAVKYLADWFSRYTKNRDLLFRKISNITEEDNKVIVEQKDGKKTYYYIEPFPEDLAGLASSIKEEHKGIVLYNSKDNFDSLLKSWNKLITVKNLSIYFVNPFSKQEKRWVISPAVHHMISDAESLELGLNSMYILVDPITKKEVEELTK